MFPDFGSIFGFDPASLGQQGQQGLLSSTAMPDPSPATPDDKKMAQLQPFFADRLQDMQQDRQIQGQPGFSITSGYRDGDQQAKLYAEKGPGLAAAPGHSNHEFGVATDIAYQPGAKDDIHAIAGQYGLRFPMGYEPWHVEPTEAAGGALRNTPYTPGASSVTPVSVPAISAVTSGPMPGTSLTSTPNGITPPVDPNANNVKGPDGKTPGDDKLAGIAGIIKGIQNKQPQQQQAAPSSDGGGAAAAANNSARYAAAQQLMATLLGQRNARGRV